MAHRLLRTLVFSSSLLLEGVSAPGCASSHPGLLPDAGGPLPTDAPTRTDVGTPRPDAGGGVDAPVAPDAPSIPDVPSLPDVPPDPDAGVIEGDAGLLYCEVGWPTTKAQTCEVDATGLALCCRPSFFDDAGPRCCIGRPEDHF